MYMYSVHCTHWNHFRISTLITDLFVNIDVHDLLLGNLNQHFLHMTNIEVLEMFIRFYSLQRHAHLISELEMITFRANSV